MEPARSTILSWLRLALIAWAVTRGGDALAGLPLAGLERPAVELSAGLDRTDGRPSQERLSGPVLADPCTTECVAAYAPFASSWRYLQGDLSALERGLFADAADGRWDEHCLLTAALIASGVTDARALNRYQARFDELTAELEELGLASRSPRRRAQAIYEAMHRRFLTGGYQVDATDLALVLDRGRFNCVSASVLYHCLAARFGLSVCGVEVPGHAMSRLHLPDGPLDIETTCPGWFRLIDHPEKQAELLQKTIGVQGAEGSSPEKRREVSDVELVATIYYNRGVDLLAQKRFAEAVVANAKALRLDPSSTTARGNLLATINNGAVEAASAGRHAEAVGLLRQGIALDRRYETFRVNYVHVHSQWIDDLTRDGRFGEALALVDRADEDSVDPAYFAGARLDVVRRWARAHLEAGRTDEAFAVFDEASRPGGPWPELQEAEAAEVSRYASELVRRGRFAEAVALLDEALARQADSAVLGTSRRTAVAEWARSAMDEGDYAEAIRRLTYGTPPEPTHESLAGDVHDLYSRWISELLARGRRVEAWRVTRRALGDPFLSSRTDGPIAELSGR